VNSIEFHNTLKKFFRFTRDPRRDNLPSLAKSRGRWGVHNRHGRNALAKVMADMDLRKGAEIGTHLGESAKIWCDENPNLFLTCIDPYLSYPARRSQPAQDNTYEKACENLQGYNVKVVRGSSLDVVDDFEDGSLDFVYIDGDHEFDPVMQDLICWAPKVRSGGVIALHDYCVMAGGGVIQAIDAYTHCHRIDSWYVTADSCPTAFWQKGSERA